MQAGTVSAPTATEDEPSEVRTFGVPDESDTEQYDPNY
jgi:hypothetical protein